jgi:hypothetical protein
LLVAGDHGWESNGQMLIAAMRGHQEWMAFLIVQDDQSAAPQNLFQAPYQSTGNQGIGVDSFAVSINVEDRNKAICQMLWCSPESGSPACQNFSEYHVSPHFRQFRQKPLGVAIAQGLMATGEQGESLAGVAA